MMLTTERLLLRPWTEADAADLFFYARDPAVGPIAGWPPHKSLEESRAVIQTVFAAPECYALCEREAGRAIGALELKLGDRTDMTDRPDECELGYWLGRPFWGRGYMPEAAAALLRRAFGELGMRAVWCGYYEGNDKSRRVQEKLGFAPHHVCREVPVPLLGEVRVGYANRLTREQWAARAGR